MRVVAPLACMALTLSIAARGDDLFSEVAVESVFGVATKASDSGSFGLPSAPAPTGRVTGAGQLGELLREAGLEPERVDSKTVSLQVRHGDWKIPTVLSAAVDRAQIDVTMALSTPEKGKWDATKLLRLIADPERGGTHFAFDSSKGQVQLRLSLPARGLTASELGRVLPEMAELAVSREDAWRAVPASTGTGAGSAAAAADAKLPGLIGAWVASLGGGEAFAVKLTDDGRFRLAHVKGGKASTSTGTASRTGDQLRLAGDTGVTITGAVSGASAAGFDLTLAGGKKLVFRKSGK